MRTPLILCLILFAAAPAMAQVTVDLGALQALPEHPASSQPVRRPATPRPAAARPATAEAEVGTKTGTEAAKPGTEIAKTGTEVAKTETPPASAGAPPKAASPTGTPPTGPLPTMPQAAPETASIPAVEPPAPAPGAAPPPPPPVSADAGTVAAPTKAGLRLTFQGGQSDLTPESVASIKALTEKMPMTDSTTYNVAAYAPGPSDDPSTARRLSLSRAMAVRNALVSDGVPSPRIFVRAMGAQYGDGPPDRVDIDVEGGGSPQAASK